MSTTIGWFLSFQRSKKRPIPAQPVLDTRLSAIAVWLNAALGGTFFLRTPLTGDPVMNELPVSDTTDCADGAMYDICCEPSDGGGW